MRPLNQRRRQRSVLHDRPVLAMVDEVLVGPDAADQIDRLDEHFARLHLVDAEGFEFRRAQAAPQTQVEAAPVRLSNTAASSATSSGFRNGRMLIMLANRRRRILCGAAAIIDLTMAPGRPLAKNAPKTAAL